MSEQHQYFPSGTWEGIYKYPSEHDGSRHEMYCMMDFKDGAVTGSGSDDVGGFSWRGNYDTQTFKVVMTKLYATHHVNYEGMADENGIYGRWSMVFGVGGFHLWPQKGGEEVEEEEVAVKAITVKLSS